MRSTLWTSGTTPTTNYEEAVTCEASRKAQAEGGLRLAADSSGGIKYDVDSRFAFVIRGH